MKYVGLVDCNNFFVSCERLFRPDLLHKPTVVLSSNDGCVVARSQEVKKLGIPMGVPHFKVKKEFEEAGVQVFSSNFQLYRDISSRVMEILRQEVGLIEQYSVDEAFFAFSESEEKVEDLLRQVKVTVEHKVGIPVSVGAAKTKTIAKYASEKEKGRRGFSFLVGQQWQMEAKQAPIGQIWGIGGKTAIKLKEHQVETVADLLVMNANWLQKNYGVGLVRIQSELLEQSIFSVGQEKDLQKTIMSSRSFRQAVENLPDLEAAVAYHANHAAEELRELGAKAQSVRVVARPSGHGSWFLHGGSREAVLVKPTSDTREIVKVATQMLALIYEKGVPYKKAGVILGMIQDCRAIPQSLFEESVFSENVVMEVIDELNTKIGKQAVTVGYVDSKQNWLPSRKYASPKYTTEWNDVVVVKA